MAFFVQVHPENNTVEAVFQSTKGISPKSQVYAFDKCVVIVFNAGILCTYSRNYCYHHAGSSVRTPCRWISTSSSCGRWFVHFSPALIPR